MNADIDIFDVIEKLKPRAINKNQPPPAAL